MADQMLPEKGIHSYLYCKLFRVGIPFWVWEASVAKGSLSLVRALLIYTNANTRKGRWLHQMKKLRSIKFSKYLNCKISDNKDRDST